MRKRVCVALVAVWALVCLRSGGAQTSFTVDQVTSYPYPAELVASPVGSRIAWVFNEKGVRNIWAAEGPDFQARRLTGNISDDGQELTNLEFSTDGNYIVYVRGGDHDANWPAPGYLQPNPASSPVQPKLEIWAVPFAGSAPRLLAEGDQPSISPRGDRVAFLRDGQIWSVPLDGSKPAARLFFCRGTSRSPEWSPDGSKLAFVSDRDDHSFIALYTGDQQPIRYIAPTTSRDDSPRWSQDGKRITFIRRPGRGGPPQTILEQHPDPWAIWVADVSAGEAHLVWKSPRTLTGSLPRTEGNANLNWGAGDLILFLAYVDGWPHLYSVSSSGGAAPLLLTPGNFMVEYVTVTPDGKSIVYNANTGPDRDDIDRRHLFRVPVDAAKPEALTSGKGLEWTPAVTGDGRSIAFLAADAQKPPLPYVLASGAATPKPIASDRISSDFPVSQMVTPRAVTVRAEDGVEVHCQLFETSAGPAKKPAVIFVHGGPPRQMLLGWHYMDYYSNSYAMNQYLANHGYVVLSVNYRLGIGYGYAFHYPERAGARGAAEYKDVVAAGIFLQSYDKIDPKRIGIWGGSYGGYLTALALARNSDIFAAGVDLHGVHDRAVYLKTAVADDLTSYEKSDVQQALGVAWNSSTVASVEKWKSPVLFIHGDDDRNVLFHQTVDLVQRLDALGVHYEELVLPDEIHGFLRHQSWLVANKAMAAFFDRTFGLADRR